MLKKLFKLTVIVAAPGGVLFGIYELAKLLYHKYKKPRTVYK